MPSIDRIKASDGTGPASIATVQSTRAALSSTIVVDTVDNINTTFYGTMGTPHTFVDPVTSETITVISEATAVDFSGHVDGSNLEIDAIDAGFTDNGSDVGDIIIIKPTTEHMNNVAEVLEVSMNDDGTLKAVVANQGWTDLTYQPNSVTANGNRSYDLVFNGVDLTPTVSPGMRLRTTRTVSAPTQCTSLNGTTQYYSKSSPAGMTFTDDFVVSAWVKLSSYATGQIVSRYNGTSGWQLYVTSTGQIVIAGYNAGAANYSIAQTYQSVPLNKWVHVTAQLDMSTFTATTTTSYVMIDGVDVPVSILRGGTNPTALVQAGNLEIGSTNGGSQFFPGKIAQVAIYNAKVTQATIKASISQGLSGSETSLISAYSFNNAITDLSANANNLTANGAAVATNADSPFGGQASGLISATLDYGIIQSVTFSTNTTVVVQVPEGCTIPTSGGVSAVSYSTQKAPYGMPVQRGKWQVATILATNLSLGVAGLATFYDSNVRLIIPVGNWVVKFEGISIFTSTTTGAGTPNDGRVIVATTSASTNRIRKLGTRAQNGNTTQTTAAWCQGSTTDTIELSAATSYSVWFNQIQYTGGAAGFQALGADADYCLILDNAYL